LSADGNPNHEENTAANSIKFEISDNMKEAGIYEFKLVDSEFIFTFSEGGIRWCSFSRKKDSLSDIANKIKKKLKNIFKKGSEAAALQDIENLLIEHRGEIFSVKNSSYANNVSGNDESKSKSKYIDKVTNLRLQYTESKLSYQQWQLLIAEKYGQLRIAVDKNFPAAWTLLQFCLAMKSILNIEGCTLPFMGVILAIPSSMKTLVIQLFRKYAYSLYSDNFTPNSFQSHNAALNEEQLRKIDLLPKLHNRLFLTPELAPVFTANEDDLRKSLGIITRVLDGHGLETDSGAQGHRHYGNTFFVWIGAAVEIPYRVWNLLGTLGHKIYFFRPEIPEKTVEDLERMAKENDFPDKFKETENALLEYLVTFDAAPMDGNITIDHNNVIKVKWNEKNGDEQNQAILCLARVANLLKRLRGTVYISQSKTRTKKYNSGRASVNNDDPKDKIDKENEDSSFDTIDELDYDTDYPIIEDPSRAVVLLRNLALGNAISVGRDFISLDDVLLVINVALSTTTRARSELIKLLLNHPGPLTTSEVVKRNKVSPPFAKRTMRELGALGIVNVSAVAGYNNSELKITLKEEYSWFKEGQFKELLHRNKPVKNNFNQSSVIERSDEAKARTIGIISLNKEDCTNTIAPIRCTFDICDHNASQSHAETKSIPQSHIKNIDEHTDSDNTNELEYGSDESETYQSTKESQIARLSDNKYDSEVRSEEKNNAPVWGSKQFQHVTVTRSHVDSADSTDDFQYTSDRMVQVIREANGSEISFNFVVESVYSQNERVKLYLGEKLTSRENKKVRYLAVEIIRNKNIEVVKYKPLLLVKWTESTKVQDNPTLAI
jgi:hypothetical protein